jgi:hypothetical protein
MYRSACLFMARLSANGSAIAVCGVAWRELHAVCRALHAVCRALHAVCRVLSPVEDVAKCRRVGECLAQQPAPQRRRIRRLARLAHDDAVTVLHTQVSGGLRRRFA